MNNSWLNQLIKERNLYLDITDPLLEELNVN